MEEENKLPTININQQEIMEDVEIEDIENNKNKELLEAEKIYYEKLLTSTNVEDNLELYNEQVYIIEAKYNALIENIEKRKKELFKKNYSIKMKAMFNEKYDLSQPNNLILVENLIDLSLLNLDYNAKIKRFDVLREMSVVTKNGIRKFFQTLPIMGDKLKVIKEINGIISRLEEINFGKKAINLNATISVEDMEEIIKNQLRGKNDE